MPTAAYMPNPYIGRFAPSPTGLLHLGSLVAALGSYLDARAARGTWLLRIEDIDPPREMPGAKQRIVQQLREHGLLWDAELSYQSARVQQYRQVLHTLKQLDCLYTCACTRQQIQNSGGVHQRHNSIPQGAGGPFAYRLRCDDPYQWNDIFATCNAENTNAAPDPILWRKDGWAAYQLAVAVDDLQQGITHVIRGRDLAACTAVQGYIIRLLGGQPPQYGHLPLVVDRSGAKLSKQNRAPALRSETPTENLLQAYALLGHEPPPLAQKMTPTEFLDYARQHWRRELVPSSFAVIDTPRHHHA